MTNSLSRDLGPLRGHILRVSADRRRIVPTMDEVDEALLCMAAWPWERTPATLREYARAIIDTIDSRYSGVGLE